ncbi:MAG: hypothetical protein LW875_11020 [Proteobacteria bacterium]|jgi:hypothetical protein|nr:hypothetical protein [Pseudomonadota bacterium]
MKNLILGVSFLLAASGAQAQSTVTVTLDRPQLVDQVYRLESAIEDRYVLDLNRSIQGLREISKVRIYAKARDGAPYIGLRVSRDQRQLSGFVIRPSDDFFSQDLRSFDIYELTNFSRGAMESAHLVIVGRPQVLPADKQQLSIARIEVEMGAPSEIEMVAIATQAAVNSIGTQDVSVADSALQIQPRVVMGIDEVSVMPATSSKTTTTVASRPVVVPMPAPVVTTPRPAAVPAPAREFIELRDRRNNLRRVFVGDSVEVNVAGLWVEARYMGRSDVPGEVMVRYNMGGSPKSRRIDRIRAL